MALVTRRRTRVAASVGTDNFARLAMPGVLLDSFCTCCGKCAMIWANQFSEYIEFINQQTIVRDVAASNLTNPNKSTLLFPFQYKRTNPIPTFNDMVLFPINFNPMATFSDTSTTHDFKCGQFTCETTQ
jgi:hypothetical protein